MPSEFATAPESAKLLKAALRTAFPATTFTVRLDRGTAYGWCSVSWTDGPTMQRVQPICDEYEGEGFDGSTDSTIHYRTIMPDGRLTGLRGVLTQRHISPSLARRCAAQVAAYWGLTPVNIVERASTCSKEIYWTTEPIVFGQLPDSEALDKTQFHWSTLIHQAASDRTRFTFSQES